MDYHPRQLQTQRHYPCPQVGVGVSVDVGVGVGVGVGVSVGVGSVWALVMVLMWVWVWGGDGVGVGVGVGDGVGVDVAGEAWRAVLALMSPWVMAWAWEWLRGAHAVLHLYGIARFSGVIHLYSLPIPSRQIHHLANAFTLPFSAKVDPAHHCTPYISRQIAGAIIATPP